MKRTTFIIAACCLILAACAQKNNQNTPNQGKENPEMKKTLVVYFSATGTTKAAAQRLANEFNADLYEIAPEQPLELSPSVVSCGCGLGPSPVRLG